MAFFKTLSTQRKNLFLICRVVSCNKFLETLEMNKTHYQDKGFCLQNVTEVSQPMDDSSTPRVE